MKVSYIYCFSAFCLLLVLASGREAVGQIPGNSSAEEDQPKTDNRVGGWRKKHGYYLLVSHRPTKVLYGNQCVENYTKSLGFVYAPYYGEPFYIDWATNFRTNWVMLFRHGPGWKRKVKKRIRDCRTAGGDYRLR